MEERRTRWSFTKEFKAQAVKRLLDVGKGLSEVATELGIGTGQLSQWRTEHLAPARLRHWPPARRTRRRRSD
ncbi:transposase [Belnapia sp. T18]|uniref:Transposase n=1 Tax=Belnapia arida TaxID=2804533 RepID=A0ABS1UAP4_9PROT|nr:transposase [Belnapia arida]MBL6081758.1 transposase [Belnapia arida]